MHFSKVFEVTTTRNEKSPLETLPRTQDETANAVASGILLGAMLFGLGPPKIVTRQATHIFGDSTNAITKQLTELNNSVVTIRVLDQKISYTSMCTGDTLEYDATNHTLKLVGGTKCQLPKNLRIVGNQSDVEPLVLVPVHLEVVSIQYLAKSFEESQERTRHLENQMLRIEQRLAHLEKMISRNPFI